MIIFFKKNLEVPTSKEMEINTSYRYCVFIPSLWEPVPKGIEINLTFFLWSIYSILWKIKKNVYELHLLYDKDILIHYSVVLPKYYRFPFMERKDIEIGPCWTHKNYRGQHLYPFVLTKIINKFTNKQINVWMFCDEGNISSRSGILRAGFEIVGYGEKTRLLGLKLLGQYRIVKQ
ncbi:MAG: hypothetical protein BWY36_00871 [Candidatus Diapherotrites archaeon ADurb.Bin253]|nr:MAG: hypothetical protein BWY36_00871 [Candidatus Diapherotrites archaeon ADurb.Bin253]